jgi:hypothetical protein
LFAGIAALLFASLAHAEVFRCNSQGRVVYSDRPCADGATVVKIVATTIASVPIGTSSTTRASGAGASSASASAQAKSSAGGDSAYSAGVTGAGPARFGNRIATGMTSVEVLRIEGMPVAKTSEKISQGVREVWTYCRDDGYTDVELKDSVVVAVSRRAASPSGVSAAAATAPDVGGTDSASVQSSTFVESRKNPAGAPAAALGARQTSP